MKRLLPILLFALAFPLVFSAQMNTEKKSNLMSRTFTDVNKVECDSVNAKYIVSLYTNEYLNGGLKVTESLNHTILSGINYSNLKDLVKNGIAKHYDEDNHTMQQFQYVNNKLNGNFFEYFDNKTVYIQGKYVDDKLNDTLKSFYPNLKSRRIDIYKNDELISGKCFSSIGADTTYFPFEMGPEFIEEDGNINLWVAKNLHYPGSAIEEGIQGTVYVAFIVEKDGAITFYKIIKGVSPELDREVKRLIEKMPTWKPGEKDGYKQKSYMQIPIHFRLD